MEKESGVGLLSLVPLLFSFPSPLLSRSDLVCKLGHARRHRKVGGRRVPGERGGRAGRRHGEKKRGGSSCLGECEGARVFGVGRRAALLFRLRPAALSCPVPGGGGPGRAGQEGLPPVVGLVTQGRTTAVERTPARRPAHFFLASSSRSVPGECGGGAAVGRHTCFCIFPLNTPTPPTKPTKHIHHVRGGGGRGNAHRPLRARPVGRGAGRAGGAREGRKGGGEKKTGGERRGRPPAVSPSCFVRRRPSASGPRAPPSMPPTPRTPCGFRARPTGAEGGLFAGGGRPRGGPPWPGIRREKGRGESARGCAACRAAGATPAIPPPLPASHPLSPRQAAWGVRPRVPCVGRGREEAGGRPRRGRRSPCAGAADDRPPPLSGRGGAALSAPAPTTAGRAAIRGARHAAMGGAYPGPGSGGGVVAQGGPARPRPAPAGWAPHPQWGAAPDQARPLARAAPPAGGPPASPALPTTRGGWGGVRRGRPWGDLSRLGDAGDARKASVALGRGGEQQQKQGSGKKARPKKKEHTRARAHAPPLALPSPFSSLPQG